MLALLVLVGGFALTYVTVRLAVRHGSQDAIRRILAERETEHSFLETEHSLL